MRRFLLSVPLVIVLGLHAADSAAPLANLTYSGDQESIEQLDRDIIAAGNDRAKLGEIATQLLAVLRRPASTFAGRQAAAQRLARVLAGDPEKASAADFKPLGTLLLDERDSDLARLALEPVPGAVVDGIFVEALDKTQGRVRLGILDSIARRRAAAAVPSLSALLQDSDTPTAAAAAHALGQIANPAAVAALHARPEPSAAPVATAKLAAASRLPTAAALGLLNELQRNARDPVHRAAAFRQTLDIEVGAAAARIAEVLGGRDALMKQVALESLVRSRAPNLVATLAEKLPTWDPATQHAVIAALGRRGEPAATPAIAAAVKHQDAEVRAAAIAALGFLPGTRDIATMLARIAANSQSTDARLARQTLARLEGPKVAAAILEGAERGDETLRTVYVEQLALRNMTEALPLLLKSRTDPDVAVRTAAVGALGEIAPVSEQKALLDWTIAATDSAEQTRALRALVNVTLRNPDVEERGRAVFAAIESAPPDVALRLLPALGRIGGAASAETAARLAGRGEAEISDAAVAALTRWTDASALPSLASVTEKAARPEVRAEAVEGVLNFFERNRDPWTSDHTAVIARLLASAGDAVTRKKLIGLLHRASDPSALAVAEKLKADPALGKEAAIAVDVIRANLAGPPSLRASTSNGIANLMDGKTSTRWTTPAQGEEWVEVDFKISRPIQRITLDQTGRAEEFPEQYEVFITDHTSQPGTPVATGKGQRLKTVIDLPAGTRGRYLIVKNVAERKDTPWAICELMVE